MASSVKLQGTGLYQGSTEVLDLKTDGSVKTYAAVASSGSITAGTLVSTGSLTAATVTSTGNMSCSGSMHILGDLDVAGSINSVTKTTSILEVEDLNIIMASGSSASDADGGGIIIGGYAATGGTAAASVLWDNGNSALDFNIGSTTEMRLQDGVLRPETDNDVDLGAAGGEFKDLYLDGTAYVDTLEVHDQANINNDVNLGNTTAHTITCTGRFDSDLLPSSDSARDLGSSALQWAEAHVDTGHIDTVVATNLQLTTLKANDGTSAGSIADSTGVVTIASSVLTATDINGGTIDGTIIGGSSAAAGSFAALNASGLASLDGGINVNDNVTVSAAGAIAGATTIAGSGLASLGSVAVDDGSNIGCDSDADLMTLSSGALAVNGTLSCDTSFTLDTVSINATEIGYLDSVTAGTAAASKALVLDSNKDVGTIRNLTIDGVFTDGNYSFDTSGNVTGLGTVGCGAITSTGDSTFGSVSPASANGGALGGASAEWSDLYLADGGVIYFGDDQDTTLTHTDGTGLTLNGTNKLCFGDADSNISQVGGSLMIADNANITVAAAALLTLTAPTALAINDGSNTAKVRVNGATGNYGLNLPDAATSGEAQARSWITY